MINDNNHCDWSEKIPFIIIAVVVAAAVCHLLPEYFSHFHSICSICFNVVVRWFLNQFFCSFYFSINACFQYNFDSFSSLTSIPLIFSLFNLINHRLNNRAKRENSHSWSKTKSTTRSMTPGLLFQFLIRNSSIIQLFFENWIYFPFFLFQHCSTFTTTTAVAIFFPCSETPNQTN